MKQIFIRMQYVRIVERIKRKESFTLWKKMSRCQGGLKQMNAFSILVNKFCFSYLFMIPIYRVSIAQLKILTMGLKIHYNFVVY